MECTCGGQVIEIEMVDHDVYVWRDSKYNSAGYVAMRLARCVSCDRWYVIDK